MSAIHDERPEDNETTKIGEYVCESRGQGEWQADVCYATQTNKKRVQGHNL